MCKLNNQRNLRQGRGNNVSYFSTRQEEQRQISQFTDVTTSNLSHETVVDIDGGTSFIKTLKEGVCEV